MVELCGARMVPGTIDVAAAARLAGAFALRRPRERALLGSVVEPESAPPTSSGWDFACHGADGEHDVEGRGPVRTATAT